MVQRLIAELGVSALSAHGSCAVIWRSPRAEKKLFETTPPSQEVCERVMLPGAKKLKALPEPAVAVHLGGRNRKPTRVVRFVAPDFRGAVAIDGPSVKGANSITFLSLSFALRVQGACGGSLHT